MIIALLAGLAAGFLHVWSGPDHLAALAPLSAGMKTRAWKGGLQWGMGHSAGVALIGLAAILLRGLLPAGMISGWGERLVGLILIGIGLWGFHRSVVIRLHVHPHEHDGYRHMHVHFHFRPHDREQKAPHVHFHAALGIGVLHGLAGSSHLLGVLPAMAFPTLAQSVCLIIAFASGTILAMVAFTALLGFIGKKIMKPVIYQGMMAFFSLAAIAVGSIWLLRTL